MVGSSEKTLAEVYTRLYWFVNGGRKQERRISTYRLPPARYYDLNGRMDAC